MSITDKKGINVTSGFKLVSGQPIDARFIAEDESDLQSLIDNGAVYEGLEVWVKSLGKKLQYNGTEFVEIATGGSSGSSSEDKTKVFEIALDPSVNIFDDAGYLSVSAEQQSVLNEMGNYLARNIETIKSVNIFMTSAVTNFEGEPGVFMDFRGGISDYINIFVLGPTPTGQSFLNEMSTIRITMNFFGRNSISDTDSVIRRLEFSNNKDGNNISISSQAPFYIEQLLQTPNPKIKVIFNLL